MVGEELLREHTDCVVLGDKGAMRQPVATTWAQHNRLARLTMPRRNEQRQLPVAVIRLLNAQRQMIETVHDQRTEQGGLETNHAHRFWGVCTRVYTTLAAPTVSVDLNRVVGNGDVLQIKRLAFPN